MKGKLHKMVSGYILSLNGDIDDPYAIVNEELAKDYEWHKLSLKNCQAIERGYDLDELAWTHAFNFYEKEDRFNGEQSFKEGFQKAIELMGDKKFSEDEVNGFIDYVIRVKHKRNGIGTGLSNKEMINANLGVFGVFEMKDIRKVYWQEYLQSLQQKEWDVEIVMEPCFYDDSLGGFSTSYKVGMPTEQPKLDSNNCLILRKI